MKGGGGASIKPSRGEKKRPPVEKRVTENRKKSSRERFYKRGRGKDGGFEFRTRKGRKVARPQAAPKAGKSGVWTWKRKTGN